MLYYLTHKQTHLHNHSHQRTLWHTYAELNSMMTKGHVWARLLDENDEKGRG
ncbi:hypothetical protein M5D96_009399, partial [Drosophila gunungcola]